MVVANHGPVLSNLYTSAKITPYEVQFSLSLERVMFYNPNVTWHDSWLAATAGMGSVIILVVKFLREGYKNKITQI